MPFQIVREDITKMKVDAIGGAIHHIGMIHKYIRSVSVKTEQSPIRATAQAHS